MYYNWNIVKLLILIKATFLSFSNFRCNLDCLVHRDKEIVPSAYLNILCYCLLCTTIFKTITNFLRIFERYILTF